MRLPSHSLTTKLFEVVAPGFAGISTWQQRRKESEVEEGE